MFANSNSYSTELIGPSSTKRTAKVPKIKRADIVLAVKIIKNISTLAVIVFGIYLSSFIFYKEFINLKGDTAELSSFTPTLRSDRAVGVTSSISIKAAANYLSQGRIFGKLEQPEAVNAPPPKAVPVTPASSNLTLVGTFLSKTRDSYTIIENKQKGEQDVFMLKDQVFDAGELKSIFPNKVILIKNGKEEILVLDEGEVEEGNQDEGGIGGETVVVSETDLQEALNNLPVLLTQARTVPYFSNGQRDGRRIFAIRSGSFFEKIGLINGDIIKTINGTDLNDDSKALELFEQFKHSRVLTVKLVRNREEKTIRYERQ